MFQRCGVLAEVLVTLQCLSQPLSVPLIACAGVVRLSSKYYGILNFKVILIVLLFQLVGSPFGQLLIS